MRSTKDLLRRLDGTEVPNDWVDATTRTVRGPVPERPARNARSRVAAGALGVAISLASLWILIGAFSREPNTPAPLGGATSPAPSPSNPLDWPPLRSVQIVEQQVVRSTRHGIVVEAPVGVARWSTNGCGVEAGPVGARTARLIGGVCEGAALSANGGAAHVVDETYGVLSGQANFGQNVTVRVTFVDGSQTEVAARNGVWMVVFVAHPRLYSPASHLATVEAVSATGTILDTVQVPS